MALIVLISLLDAVLIIEPMWDTFRESLAYLTDFAVFFRYPGESATRETALKAARFIRAFRQAAQDSLK